MYIYLKRFFDIFFSFFFILFTLPALIGISILIKLESKGPIIYRGIRAGLYGKPFYIFKFRTMVANAEYLGGFSTAINDPRLTRIGPFLRKFKIDELPQLLNVFFGQMSFVGPRPQVLYYTNLYNDEEKKILRLRPGITDLASIYFANMDFTLGTGDVNKKYQIEVEPKKNLLRLKYVYEISFRLDLKILVATVFKILGIDLTEKLQLFDENKFN